VKRKEEVSHEEICEAESEVSGPAEGGDQVQFLGRLVLTAGGSKERWFRGSGADSLPPEASGTRFAYGDLRRL
jgi:hypothetical protein